MIDHTLINDEIEFLAFRMEVLNDYVTEFHVVESTKTHSNKDKKLYLTEALEQNNPLIEPFRDKIRVSVYIPEKQYSYGSIEHGSRDFIGQVAKSYPSDTVQMIGDIDEIPTAIPMMEFPSVSVQSNYYYDFTNKWEHPHYGTVFFKNDTKLSGQGLRDNRSNFWQVMGGYHCSCFNGVDKTVNKLNSFSHTEFQDGKTNTAEWVAERIKNGEDIVERDIGFKLGKVYSLLPAKMAAAYKKFKDVASC